MTADNNRSPAAKVMDEAIDLAIEGRSPYPERAAFIDAGTPSAGFDIERAADDGLPVVLVSADGSTRVLRPEHLTHAPQAEVQADCSADLDLGLSDDPR